MHRCRLQGHPGRVALDQPGHHAITRLVIDALQRIFFAMFQLPLTLLSITLSGAIAAPTAANQPTWWSFTPIAKPAVPAGIKGNRTPIDAFISASLADQKLSMSPEADARTLCRRLYFDLTGLPPSPEDMEAFLADSSPNAYEKLVDRLLASPRYGERWARHWLDVVHYGDTHGYDKDQPRPNAWPYRDYVIRAFNEDKPYGRFVQEQIAGDVLFPDTRDGIEALGFIAAGPWDLIGHAEVPESKTDGKIARHLDRDDMIANTINSFCSLTVHCAQCHDHKFDPISSADYYNLQSVFAALDRADRIYDIDPAVAKQRSELQNGQRELKDQINALNVTAQGNEALKALDKTIADLKKPAASLSGQMGWHSAIEAKQETLKWVQVDLGKSVTLSQVVMHPCSDTFNSIGDGFGFPVRFKIEACEEATFTTEVRILADETQKDFPNPKIRAVNYGVGGNARYVRITATKLVPRQNDFIFALSELDIMDASGKNLAAGVTVTSLDSIEAAPRWQRTNLTDGVYPGVDPNKVTTRTNVTKLEQARHLMLEALLGEKATAELGNAEKVLGQIEKKLSALPAPKKVYAGTIHHGSGAFAGTGSNGGKARPVFVLARGDVTHPGLEASPAALEKVPGLKADFALPKNAPEGLRRAALAKWLTESHNPLTWRSVVNRVWQYHFGKGLVETPNDFGKMGQLPSHPALLDWLAASFRDDMAGSLKQLHRLIVTSSVYRQVSTASDDEMHTRAQAMDSENRLLWRMNRRKLEAEAVRDSLLSVSGKLDLTMGGPAFQDFVVLHPEHSPHYEYQLADLENPALHRRSIYRFLVRSKPQPWMATLDCADPSMLVEKRNQTITPLQALAQLNNQLTLVVSKHFAARLEASEKTPEGQIKQAIKLAFGREATAQEINSLVKLAHQFGLPAACRVIVNLNEFVFVD